MERVVGIDIGATNMRVSLGDYNGRLIKTYSEKTDGKNILQQIEKLVSRFSNFEGIGIASVGPLNSKTGVILNPPNLNIRNVRIVEFLKRRFGVPARLLNDCVAAVLGEKTFGAGKNVENLAYVTISSGIGCGVIVDNKLILGKDGNAHEVGHCMVDAYSKIKCGCGSYGHWEAYCSGINMPKFAGFLMSTKYKNEKSVLLKYGKRLTSKLLFELAEKDDITRSILDEIGRLNAIGISNVINAYDTELITFGGAVVVNNAEAVLEPIKRHVKDYVVNRLPKMAITPLGEDVVLHGAVASVLKYLHIVIGD